MNISSVINVFLIAMTPIGELRAALPIALAVYNINWLNAYLISVVGNIIPVFILLLFWKYVVERVSERFEVTKHFFDWLFDRTRKKFDHKYERWGKLALILFVAIPLPVTGAWTGSVAAWLFGFRYWESVGLIFIGVLISGVIISLITFGGIAII